MKELYTLTEEENGSCINGIAIPDSVMEEVDWSIRDRYDFVEELSYTMIPEAYHAQRTSDLNLMEKDLEYLKKYDDTLMFDSMSTNAYVMESEEEDREKFNTICEDMLTLTKKMKVK